MRGETAYRRSGRRSRGALRRPRAQPGAARSRRTVRVIGPGWSKLGASGTIPRSESRPRVGLTVDVPHSADGMRREPAVSVPVAAGTWLDASAALEPPLEPPAERSSDHGLPTWSVVPPQANSCVCRWPSRTIPAADEARPGVAVPVGNLVEHAARGGERLPGDGVEVLQPDRDPAERRVRRPPRAARRRARRPRGRPPRRRGPRRSPSPGRRRGEWAPSRSPDPGEARLHELARRERSAAQCLGGVHDAEVGRIGHGAIISRATNIVDEPIVAA